MSLSRYLQSPEILSSLSQLNPEELKARIIERGKEWFALRPEESQHIAENLSAFGITADGKLLDLIRHHLLLHYFEKLLPLCGTASLVAEYLRTRVQLTSGDLDTLRSAAKSGFGVLLAVCHFGAVELISPYLLMHGLPITAALRFATEELAQKVKMRAQELSCSGLFAAVRFIEIGKPHIAAAVEMAAALRRREILLAVFDEDTAYSTEAQLLGRKVRGGAGIDRILRFVNAPVRIMAAFMERSGDDTYQLHLFDVPGGSVQELFDCLQQMLHSRLEQWYFLHESIPFALNNSGRQNG